jgi:UDPglucose 6-dehydrogenase/GDP-mannose 6-dehydrogenase
VVAVRSTVVPGTADSLAPLFADGAAVASNPEFLQEGSAVEDFLHPDRVVIGAHEPWAQELLTELYAPLGATAVLTTPATAELAKYASNALLATLISFSNELASISEALTDVDVEDVLRAVHLDRRLSPRVDGATISPGILAYLRAGCGYGGSCLPKDLSALVATRRAHGESHPLLEAVQAVNDAQPGRVADLLERRLGPLRGRRVGVLGLAFKAGTDDVRSSPALRIVDELLGRGAEVQAFDPLVRPEALDAWSTRGLRVVDTLDEVVAGTDACLIATADPAFSEAAELAAAHGTLLLDGRRLLPVERLGDTHLAVGRAAPQAGRPSGEPGAPTST